MTKADLVERAADAVGRWVTKGDCGLVVDAFLDAVKDALARGDHIELRGFGTFRDPAPQGSDGPQTQDRRRGRGPCPRPAGLPTVEASSARGVDRLHGRSAKVVRRRS